MTRRKATAELNSLAMRAPPPGNAKSRAKRAHRDQLRCLGILAGAEAAAGRPLSAARLCGAMEGLLESVGAPVQASYHRWIGDQYLARIKDALGARAYQDAVDDGRAMSLPDAVAHALDQQA
jgi:hypothetical protein